MCKKQKIKNKITGPLPLSEKTHPHTVVYYKYLQRSLRRGVMTLNSSNSQLSVKIVCTRYRMGSASVVLRLLSAVVRDRRGRADGFVFWYMLFGWWWCCSCCRCCLLVFVVVCCCLLLLVVLLLLLLMRLRFCCFFSR